MVESKRGNRAVYYHSAFCLFTSKFEASNTVTNWADSSCQELSTVNWADSSCQKVK